MSERNVTHQKYCVDKAKELDRKELEKQLYQTQNELHREQKHAKDKAVLLEEVNQFNAV